MPLYIRKVYKAGFVRAALYKCNWNKHPLSWTGIRYRKNMWMFVVSGKGQNMNRHGIDGYDYHAEVRELLLIMVLFILLVILLKYILI
ncbi:hypothetical protein D5F53_21145 [Paenibacillus lautus]|uniref:Uncharacterized protein n=1 Tax=Paenibacillus lautus TaxID=1401 RepID=A0A385TQE1_PAELA|nr:hypothetical protein D5F53_21145 [Paenibacillus lautus]